MRLKNIKLAGFKSFVDPTNVQFPSNMSAVVGPNGCGKSNVIDAVRWVMGESSAKNLRGEHMTDVIFNGSVNRQPVGQATIELVFDNQDGGVGGEYASYSEISVRRQVTREGQSEYFLNGTRCRRRDITDIFLGTGLGPRSYAIIEQGMISRLIESKPEELRIFIEEAAGISKYKERRKETESRMRRTLENLERLTDIRDELERQLQHLQRQAQAAEKYSDFKAEERETRAQLYTLQWQSLDEQISAARFEIGELDVKLEAVIAEHRQLDASIEELRVTHTESTDQFNEVQARYYGLGSDVARIEQTIKHQQERSRQLTDDLGQTEMSLDQSQQHLVEDRERQQSWSAELETLRPELEQLQAAESASSNSLQSAEESMQEWQSRWDEFNQSSAEPRQQAEVQQSRIQHLEQALQRIQQRLGSLEQELGGLSAGPADEICADLQRQIDAHETDMAAQEQNNERLLQRVNEGRDQRDQLSGQLDQARGELQQMRGRRASLEALQQAAAAAGSGVDTWLSQQQLSDKPRLLEQIQVDPVWQLATETVLGDTLQAVCVDQVEALEAALSDPAAGGLSLVADTVPAGQAAAETLAAKVVAGVLPASLLENVLCAPDLATALRMRASLAPQQSVVTAEGIWLGRDWVRVADQSDDQRGTLERQQELEQLLLDISATEQRVGELEVQLHALGEELKMLESQRHDGQRNLQSVTREHSEKSARLSAEQAKIEQISKRRESMQRDITDSRDQYQNEQSSLAEARQLLSTAIESMEHDSRQREELLSSRDAIRGRLDEARQLARVDRDGAQQLAMRVQSLQAQLESIEQSIARTRGQVDQLLGRKETLQESLSSNSTPLEGLQSELEEKLQLRLSVESELSEARQKVAEIDHALREAESRRAAIEQRSTGVRSDLEQRKLHHQTLQVQRENVQKLLQESGHVVADVIADMPDGADEAEWQRRLEQLANRISRLGPINLAAIDEYSQQSERKHYLDAQNEDLESALETLESAIRKIDRETRNRFRDTFEQVNSSLQELFPRVFGGGSAYLEMTGDDLLDTGITIMARPPGKKNSTIHLLSGGEKALTAIALVFSIFRLNPAPFCMLDEVDAPLDDANTARYARMVKEMSDKVQFIFITHNKITMEMADQLMGVTMQEPGVSRLVSVDVEEAAELAAM